MNIDFSSPSIHGLACKKSIYLSFIQAENVTSYTMSALCCIIGFKHGVLGLTENPARGTGFWSQNTEDVARGVLTEKARPNVGLLLITPLGTYFFDIWMKICQFSYKKIYLEIPYAIWWPCCLSSNVLIFFWLDGLEVPYWYAFWQCCPFCWGSCWHSKLSCSFIIRNYPSRSHCHPPSQAR